MFSSTKPGLPPIWRAKADAAGEGDGCVGIPHGHYKTITLVAGLRLSGLVAQKAFGKPMNAATFEDWVEKCLVPTTVEPISLVLNEASWRAIFTGSASHAPIAQPIESIKRLFASWIASGGISS